MNTRGCLWPSRNTRRPLILALAFVTIVLGACERRQPTVGRKPNGQWVIRAVKQDERLLKAAQEAQRRWPEFAAAFAKKEANVAYAVKLPFKVRDSEKSEHMWIQVTSIDGTTITGELNNEPINDIGLTPGDSVTASLDQIEDWLIGRGKGNLTGGFSIPVLEQIEREAQKKP